MTTGYSAAGLYSGLAPEEALQRWYALRQKPQSQLTPQEAEDVAGNMTNLAKENPQAWALLKSGGPQTGDTRPIFNTQTGQWDQQKVQGFWDHPESWFQVAAGAGLGGAVAAPAIAGMGGGAAAPGAMTGAEMSAKGLVGPGLQAASGVNKAMDLMKLGLGGAGVVGAMTHANTASQSIPPELQQMLDLQRQRMQMQNPLYEAVTRMAMNRLPTNLTQGAGPNDPITQAMQRMSGGK